MATTPVVSPKTSGAVSVGKTEAPSIARTDDVLARVTAALNDEATTALKGSDKVVWGKTELSGLLEEAHKTFPKNKAVTKDQLVAKAGELAAAQLAAVNVKGTGTVSAKEVQAVGAAHPAAGKAIAAAYTAATGRPLELSATAQTAATAATKSTTPELAPKGDQVAAKAKAANPAQQAHEQEETSQVKKATAARAKANGGLYGEIDTAAIPSKVSSIIDQSGELVSGSEMKAMLAAGADGTAVADQLLNQAGPFAAKLSASGAAEGKHEMTADSVGVLIDHLKANPPDATSPQAVKAHSQRLDKLQALVTSPNMTTKDWKEDPLFQLRVAAGSNKFLSDKELKTLPDDLQAAAQAVRKQNPGKPITIDQVFAKSVHTQMLAVTPEGTPKPAEGSPAHLAMIESLKTGQPFGPIFERMTAEATSTPDAKAKAQGKTSDAAPAADAAAAAATQATQAAGAAGTVDQKIDQLVANMGIQPPRYMSGAQMDQLIAQAQLVGVKPEDLIDHLVNTTKRAPAGAITQPGMPPQVQGEYSALGSVMTQEAMNRLMGHLSTKQPATEAEQIALQQRMSGVQGLMGGFPANDPMALMGSNMAPQQWDALSQTVRQQTQYGNMTSAAQMMSLSSPLGGIFNMMAMGGFPGAFGMGDRATMSGEMAAMGNGAGFLTGNASFDLARSIAGSPPFSPTEMAMLSQIQDPQQRALQMLQMFMQKQSMLATMLTNLAQMRHDMLKAVAQNLRS